ncbi:MAG: cobalt ECF transporter T component CbiQ [Anaerolineae bacterium]|nr:cobalt ECF transporter T component CbiQ [Anaerolineae bacterium]
MHVHFLDSYRPRPSLIHALDPRVKLVLALAFILAVAFTPIAAWPAYLLLIALAFSVAMLSELGVGFVLKRSALALPFMLAALPILFTAKGVPLWSTALAGWTIAITDAGVQRFLSILLKSWLSVQMAVVLAASTTFPHLLLAMRAIGIPRLIVAIFGLMWRYLFVLVDEALRLLRARAARSGAPAMAGVGTGRRVGGSVAWRARVAGGMAGNLLVRSFDRGERIYAAMAARGYDGEVRPFPLPPLPAGQKVLLSAGLMLLGLVVILGYLV